MSSKPIWGDPIVEEIRRDREASAAKFNFDLKAIFENIVRQQESGREIVSSPSKRPSAKPQSSIRLRKTRKL